MIEDIHGELLAQMADQRIIARLVDREPRGRGAVLAKSLPLNKSMILSKLAQLGVL